MATWGEDPRSPREAAGAGAVRTGRHRFARMFVGVHDRQLDDKGRVALPASFRGELGERCYVSLGEDGCVTIRETTEFEAHARELIDSEKRGMLTRSHRRSVAVTSTIVSIDKQGRITLEEKVRQHAGLRLNEPVKVAGTFDAIEVWRPSRFDAVASEGAGEQPVRVWDDEQ
jgi:MraZ protein